MIFNFYIALRLVPQQRSRIGRVLLVAVRLLRLGRVQRNEQNHRGLEPGQDHARVAPSQPPRQGHPLQSHLRAVLGQEHPRTTVEAVSRPDPEQPLRGDRRDRAPLRRHLVARQPLHG